MIVYLLREICYEKRIGDVQPSIKSMKFSRFNKLGTAQNYLRILCKGYNNDSEEEAKYREKEGLKPVGPKYIVERVNPDKARVINDRTIMKIFDYHIIKVYEPKAGIFYNINEEVVSKTTPPKIPGDFDRRDSLHVAGGA